MFDFEWWPVVVFFLIIGAVAGLAVEHAGIFVAHHVSFHWN